LNTNFTTKINALRAPKLTKKFKSIYVKTPEYILNEEERIYQWSISENKEKEICLNPNDWCKVRNYILANFRNKYAYFQYCRRSKSADFTIVLPTNNIIEFQMKSRQKITYNLISKELSKVKIDKDYYYTFIIVGLSEPDELIKQLKEENVSTTADTLFKVIEQGSTPLSVLLYNGKSIKIASHTLNLSSNLECLIMCQEGLKQLLGEAAYNILNNQILYQNPKNLITEEPQYNLSRGISYKRPSEGENKNEESKRARIEEDMMGIIPI